MATDRPAITVFHFAPAWGLPTSGPFALKLLGWLGLHGIPYRGVVENNSRKGPRGKSPWAVIDGETVADSDRIIATLADRLGIADAEARLAPAQAGAAQAFATAYEERLHQVLEYELFVEPAGLAGLRALMRGQVPRLALAPLLALTRRHFARQLHARGIARHGRAEVAALAEREFTALARYLDDRRFIAGDAPGLSDLACYGQFAPMLRWPMKTPVAGRAKAQPRLAQWCDAVETACFGAPCAGAARMAPAA